MLRLGKYRYVVFALALVVCGALVLQSSWAPGAGGSLPPLAAYGGPASGQTQGEYVAPAPGSPEEAYANAGEAGVQYVVDGKKKVDLPVDRSNYRALLNKWRWPLKKKPLPKANNAKRPVIQHAFATPNPDTKALAAIKLQFRQTWDQYCKYAWGHDELAPITKLYVNSFNALSFTLVDLLDVLWIMGLTEEFERAVQLVMELDFYALLMGPHLTGKVPVFEANIRILGGLLSAYELSNRAELLDKAVEMGEILLKAFDTPNNLPNMFWNIKMWDKHQGLMVEPGRLMLLLAEWGTLLLEFVKMAQLTKDARYWSAVDHLYANALNMYNANPHGLRLLPGLLSMLNDLSGCEEVVELHEYVPKTSNPQKRPILTLKNGQRDQHEVCIARSDTRHSMSNGRTKQVAYTVGGMADSFYEYLVKMKDMLGSIGVEVPSSKHDGPNSIHDTAELAHQAMQLVEKHLLYRPYMPRDGRLRFPNERVLFLNDVNGVLNGAETFFTKVNQWGHLLCFMGGAFAQYAQVFHGKDEAKRQHYIDIGAALTRGCLELTHQCGLMPETVELMGCAVDATDAECMYDEDKVVEWINKAQEPQAGATEQLPNVGPNGGWYRTNEEDDIQVRPIPDPQYTAVKGKHGWLRERQGVASMPVWALAMNPAYQLRPELIELVFVLYRVTGDEYWRKQGWWLYEKTIAACTFGDTVAGVRDVTEYRFEVPADADTKGTANAINKVELFWFAETLKYFYLLFAEETLVLLDEYVLNTEAHPLRKL